MKRRIRTRFFQGGILGLLGAVLFAAAVAIVRLAPGIPNAIDSTSHLYRILFMFDSLRKLGYVPTWSPDWYAGTAFTLLYPPLSYWIVLVVTFTGVTPIAAYKIVDALAYVASPITVYILCRELKMDGRTSAFSAFLFSLSPTVIENYLFYDRFPSTLSLPLACLFIACLLRATEEDRPHVYVTTSAVIFAALILIHHLSALLLSAIAILVLVIRSISSWSVGRRLLATATIPLVSGVAIASFWIIPFLQASNRLVANSFYNRNVEFPFVRLSYFLMDLSTYSLGVSHLALAIYSLGILLFTNSLRPMKHLLVSIAVLLGGMGLFELGEQMGLLVIKWLGQILIVAFFLTLVALALWVVKTNRQLIFGFKFLVSWFVVFLWLSLGNYAAPFVDLPLLAWLWRRLDVHRFWLLLAIPMSTLGAYALTRLLERTRHPSRRRKCAALFMITIAVVGGTVKAYYSMTQDISRFLPYSTASSEIPRDLIEYFRQQQEYARILAIKCPLWVYVLPRYTGKPLIDGWYPQEKLLDEIMRINDYRILDLETAGGKDNRTKIWRQLIADSDLLAVEWVLIGKLGYSATILFNETEFRLDARFDYQDSNITVYRRSPSVSFVEVSPSTGVTWSFERPTPDTMVVGLQGLKSNATITIKEAYYQTWQARADGASLSVGKNKSGFITLQVGPHMKTVELYHKTQDTTLATISLVSLMVLLATTLIVDLKGRREVRKI